MSGPSAAVPVEWIIPAPQPHGTAAAVIRLLIFDGVPRWRVVTGEHDRAQRQLVGYWSSLEEAEHNALAYWEHHAPPAWMATGGATGRAPRAPTPQAPPPPKR